MKLAGVQLRDSTALKGEICLKLSQHTTNDRLLSSFSPFIHSARLFITNLTRENGLRTRTIFNPLYALLFPSMNYPAHLVNGATVPVKLEPDHDTALAPGPTAIKKKRRQLVGPYPALLPPPLTTSNSMRWLPVSYNLFSSRLPLID